MYVSVPTQRGVPTHHVYAHTYIPLCIYTYAYMRVPVLPAHAMGLVCVCVYEGVPMRAAR